jgi:UMP-CMP kinase
MAKDCELEMVSVDHLLREEQNRPGSIFGDFIKESLEKSVIAPTSLTTMLLKSKIKEIQSKGRGVLIEGFPQSVSQAVAFDREVSRMLP